LLTLKWALIYYPLTLKANTEPNTIESLSKWGNLYTLMMRSRDCRIYMHRVELTSINRTADNALEWAFPMSRNFQNSYV
jgi:hypothetical protein